MLHRVPGALQCIRGAFAIIVLALCLSAAPWDRSGAQTSQPTHTPSEESPEDFPPGPGREETFYACVACHNFKLVAAQGMSRERWDETITFMTVRHNMPALEGEDRRLILDYLATTFPERPAQRRGWQNPFQQ